MFFEGKIERRKHQMAEKISNFLTVLTLPSSFFCSNPHTNRIEKRSAEKKIKENYVKHILMLYSSCGKSLVLRKRRSQVTAGGCWGKINFAFATARYVTVIATQERLGNFSSPLHKFFKIHFKPFLLPHVTLVLKILATLATTCCIVHSLCHIFFPFGFFFRPKLPSDISNPFHFFSAISIAISAMRKEFYYPLREKRRQGKNITFYSYSIYSVMTLLTSNKSGCFRKPRPAWFKFNKILRHNQDIILSALQFRQGSEKNLIFMHSQVHSSYLIASCCWSAASRCSTWSWRWVSTNDVAQSRVGVRTDGKLLLSLN